MTARTRRLRLACALVVAVSFTFGCNVLSLPYFLMNGADPMEPPKCMKLTGDEKDKKDKDRESKVVIFASIPAETRPEFVRVDREICEHLTRKLREYYTEKKEKVVILPVSQVEKFKEEHSDWKSWDLQEIAKHFEADYVVELEIGAISLYERGSGNTLYKGKADVGVSLLPVKKADDGVIRQEFSCEYPNSKGPIPSDDMPIAQFRREFLDYVAKRLSWYFIPHPTSDQICCE